MNKPRARYVAWYDTRETSSKKWSVRTDNKQHSYGYPPGGPYQCMSYGCCRKIIGLLEQMEVEPEPKVRQEIYQRLQQLG
jgi:hypothetical protein